MSKGLGRNFLEDNTERIKKNGDSYVTQHGFKKRMPRYYRDKIFNAHEKEMLNYKTQIHVEKQEEKVMEKLERTHPNPWRYRLEQIEQQSKRIIENSKKNQKL